MLDNILQLAFRILSFLGIREIIGKLFLIFPFVGRLSIYYVPSFLLPATLERERHYTIFLGNAFRSPPIINSSLSNVYISGRTTQYLYFKLRELFFTILLFLTTACFT